METMKYNAKLYGWWVVCALVWGFTVKLPFLGLWWFFKNLQEVCNDVIWADFPKKPPVRNNE